MTRPRWRPAYVALGSNLDNPRQHLVAAVEDLHRMARTRVYRVSDVVQSKPLDGSDQPEYLNAVVGLLTALDPHQLLDQLQQIERRHGRQPDATRWSARPLDLDLLALGDICVDEDALALPHPRMADRAFVIYPLAQIAPGLTLPGLGRVSRLAAAVDFSGLVAAGSLAVPRA
jgi:2-amino-4-hydroxy-6-hydroxymethyldihydropteridine diphosphokinase